MGMESPLRAKKCFRTRQSDGRTPLNVLFMLVLRLSRA